LVHTTPRASSLVGAVINGRVVFLLSSANEVESGVEVIERTVRAPIRRIITQVELVFPSLLRFLFPFFLSLVARFRNSWSKS